MRIVVLGATGNVGTSVVERLVADPDVERVVGIARRRPQWQPQKVEWVEADIVDAELPRYFDGADAVIHLAWAFQPSHRPEVTWAVNAVGTARILGAVERADVPVLVVASSVGAYSPGDKEIRIDESWPTHGWAPAAYCREKAYVERLLDYFEVVFPRCRVVRMRPCFLFKRAAAPEQRRIFAGPFAPERLLGRFGLPVIPNLAGLQLQMMHTDDAAEAYVRAVHADVSGAFNLAAEPVIDAAALAEVFGGRPVGMPTRPVRELLALAWRLRAVPAPPDLFDYALQMPLMDASRAQLELGWEPHHSALDALAEFRNGLRGGEGQATPPLQASPRRRAP
jgi:nucleoside-diphosphate-sugar epimerase